MILALWKVHELALDTRDVRLFEKIDTGTELLTDKYEVGDIKCGCAKFYWTKGPRSIRKTTIFLPRQTRYPIFFLAEVLALTPSQSVVTGDYTAAIVVTRSRPTAPWRLAMQVYDTGYTPSGGSFLPPVTDAAGYDVAPTTFTAGVAATWPAMLVAYYNHLKTDRDPPPGTQFLPGPLTTGSGLTTRPDGYTNGGIVSNYRFVRAHLGGPWIVNTGGTPTVCSNIFEYATYRPVNANQLLVQNTNRSVWGPDLKPGLYSSVVTTYEWASCIYPYSNGLVAGGALSGGYPLRDVGHRAA